MRKPFWLPVILLLFLFVTVSNAQVKSYTIHRSPGVDEETDAAVDSSSGDIVVAWTEVIESSKDVRIWVCFLKRNPNGTYTASTPKRLSQEGLFAHDPTVAYSSVSKTFLVAYAVGLSNPVTVYAAIVKKGKIQKTRKLWIEENGFAGNTMAAAGLIKKNKVPGKKAAFVIARHNDAPALGAESVRVYLFPVSTKGKNTGTPMLMQKSGEEDEEYPGARVSDIQVGADGSIYIALRWNSFLSGGVRYNVGAIVAKRDGSFAGLATIDNQDKSFSAYIKAVVASRKSAVVAWRRGEDSSVRFQTVNKKAAVSGASGKVFDVDVAWDDFGLVAGSKNTVYFYKNNIPGDNTLFKLGGNGNVADKATFIIPGQRTTFYTMAGIPKNNELLLVTNTNIGVDKTGIVVTIIRPGALF